MPVWTRLYLNVLPKILIMKPTDHIDEARLREDLTRALALQNSHQQGPVLNHDTYMLFGWWPRDVYRLGDSSS